MKTPKTPKPPTVAQTTIRTMRERIFELVAALKVVALTPATAQYLREHDPKALAQVIEALGLTDSDITAIIAGPRPGEPVVDFVVENHGSVFRFVVTTDAAREHAQTIGLDDWQWLGTSAFAIDHRLAPDVCYRLREDGFTVVVR